MPQVDVAHPIGPGVREMGTDAIQIRNPIERAVAARSVTSSIEDPEVAGSTQTRRRIVLTPLARNKARGSTTVPVSS